MAQLHTEASTASAAPDESLQVVPRRHPWRWAASTVIVVLAAQLLVSAVTNPRFQWSTVRQYLTSESVLRGLLMTLELTALAMVIGIVGGTVLAVMRLSPNRLLARTASVYIWFFRGTPVLVQLLFWNFLQAVYPQVSLSVPFGPDLVSIQANSIITPFVAALLGLGLNEAAYMAEIIRSGILSVDPGQEEAAHALGMRRPLLLRRIVLPQAMRVIVPPTGNEVIGMLKASSMASVVAMQELLYSVQIIYSRTYQTIPLLMVASLWYLLVTSILSVLQHYIETYFSRGRGSSPQRRSLAAALVSGLRIRQSNRRNGA
ncbi:amino acid ABC transporter permease [Streptomyces sp. V4I2]|uniref:amino acid ABC transporter permease n=1 Tax=Streptomyces sp. V4I2 TaxID=3042280 RepID=UPI00278AAB11|nr:amino acid ABC transporter permease [Streptomyces sp. V4I2]MDQ1042248.1 polar amino acid transport system permease protein [Streptomyces sp. V4I2]